GSGRGDSQFKSQVAQRPDWQLRSHPRSVTGQPRKQLGSTPGFLRLAIDHEISRLIAISAARPARPTS
ncbi:MAG TPA: hypothetical protein VFA00_03305, partial [Actinomycetota bacterium]|nr:hypothetical protein [Actinomycetota bacterium]